MATPGSLKKAAFGYSMPVDAPLYPPFPIYYRNIRILLFPYLTDSAKAAALLPEQLELVEPSPGVAMAQVIFATYPFSNIGAYNEVSQTIFATYKGKPVAYAVRLHDRPRDGGGARDWRLPQAHGAHQLRRGRDPDQRAREPARHARLLG
jgi:acetoacetate decarboxylase